MKTGVSPQAYRAVLAAFLVIITIGYLLTRFLVIKAFEYAENREKAIVSMLAEQLLFETEEITGSVKTMSGSPWLFPCLLSKSVADLERANSVLDRYNAAIEEGTISYLMDREGMTVASSNRDEPDSLVGKSYDFRPYFQEALAGKLYQYFATGITTGKRGFYASSPVKDPEGNIVGVAVVKKDLGYVEARLTKHKNCFLVSPDGVIFLSGNPSLLFKSLGPIDYETQSVLLASMQFGEKPFEAMMKRRPQGGEVVNFRGQLFIVAEKGVGDKGWSMLMLVPLTEVFVMGAVGLLSTLIFLVMAGLYLMYLRFSDRTLRSVMESEDKFKMLADATNEGVLVHEEGKILEANAKLAEMLGYDLDEVLGSDIFSYIATDDKKEARQMAQTGYENPYEVNVVKKDGSLFSVEMCGKPLRYKGRQALVVSIRDITVYKEMQGILERVAQEWVTTFNSIPDLISIHDRQFRIIRANKAFADYFGMRLDEVIGKTCHQIFHNTDRPVHACPFEKVIKKREKGIVEFFEPKLGAYLEVTAAPIYNELGEITGVVHVAKDVSERRKIENALRESEQLYRSVIDNVGAGVALISPEMRVLTLNRQMKDWFPDMDLTKESVCYKIFNTPPREKICEHCPTQKTLKDGEVHEATTDMPFLGSVRNFRVVSSPIKDAKGNITAAIEMVEDVTETKKAEIATKKAFSQITQIFQSVGDGVCVIDVGGSVIQMNKAFSGMLGLAGDSLGKKHTEVMPVSLRDAYHEAIKRLEGGVERIEMDVTVERKDGINIPCIMTVTPFYDVNDRMVGVILSLKDITERKSAEKALLEGVKMKSNFMSMVSHELRTPLTAIKEGISIVLDGSAGGINEEQKDFLDTAHRNVERLARLINDVLDFTKLRAGKMVMKLEDMDAASAAEEVRKANEPVAASKGLYIRTNADGAVPRVKADRDRVMQVMSNLVNNALKFTESGGVTISISRRDDNILISVEDTGHGIKADDITQLFSEFKQLEDSKTRKTGGTGLGLAICKQIIDRHGGRIWVESEPGKGSAFRFTLPLERKYKVLVVDDDERFQDFIRKLLTDKGYLVTRAYSGLDGVEYAKKDRPDLVVLDVRLPDMNGYEVVGRLQSDEDLAGIPVLAVSGYEEELKKFDRFKSVTIPRLIKPFDSHEFISKIRVMLNQED